MQPSLHSLKSWVAGFALLATAQPVCAEVWVVQTDGGAGVDFVDIQSAVDAASDGDVILVKNGDVYPKFVIDAKALTVVADGLGVAVGLEGDLFGVTDVSMEVRNLGPGQDVVVRGFQSPTGIVISDCAGGVWFDDFHVDGFSDCITGGVHGAEVKNSQRVTFTRCTLRGETIFDPWLDHNSTDGLIAEGSVVQVFDSEISGGWGNTQVGQNPPLLGGNGVRVDASTVTLSGCTVQGGPGGLAHGGFGSICDGPHLSGGAGVLFEGAGATLKRTDTTVTGGVADLDDLCPGMTGPPGADFDGVGSLVDLPGVAHHLAVNSPAQTGETVTFELGGVSGEFAAVLVSLDHTPLPFPAAAGVLLGDLASVLVLSAGSLPASGEATLAFQVPNLGPATQSLVLYAQAAFVDASPATWLGGGSVAILF